MTDKEIQEVLQQFRDEEAPPLQFRPPVEHLLDPTQCRAVTKMMLDSGGKWERRIAVDTLGESLPEERGLYIFGSSGIRVGQLRQAPSS